MKIKPMFSGSALAFFALLTSSLILIPSPVSAETCPAPQQVVKTQPATSSAATATEGGGLGEALVTDSADKPFIVVPTSYTATAYSLRGRTASGRLVSKGLIAADPRLLPLGSRVRLQAGSYSGDYLVADTGTAVRGRRIDIWTPTSSEALRFGRRMIKLTVLSFGGRRRTTAQRAK